MIQCNKLAKRYGSYQALQDIDFRIEGKGCFAFLGVNGAGKTTTIRILTGLARASSGSASIFGLDTLRDRKKVVSKIGYLPQAPAFYGYMTGEQWMAWTGSLFKLDKDLVKQRSEKLLKEFDVWESRNRPIGGYSGGMKQRLGMAQALLNDPEVLILDEPVSALDPIGRHQVLNQIKAIKDRMTVFMSTHILDDAERIADHVIIIDKGKVLLQSTIDELRHQYADPIIHFEIGAGGPDLTDKLNTIEWLHDVRREDNMYTVAASDIDQARKQLPALIVESGADLVSYKIGRPNLEDIFLKVVK